MSLTNEQKVQLLSEPNLLAIGDFLGVEEREAKGAKYYNMTAVVGQSTQKFEIEAVEYGKLMNMKKYARVYISFREFTFASSGNTVKRAINILTE